MESIKNGCDKKGNEEHVGELKAFVDKQEEIAGQLSILAGKTGDVCAAVERFISSIKGDHKPSGILVKTGELCYEMGLFENAGYFFEKAAALDTDNPEAFNNLGVLHCRKGDLETARGLFEKALELDPDNTDARKNVHLLDESFCQSAGDNHNGTDEKDELLGMKSYWDACAEENAMRHIACDDWQSEEVFNVCGERDLMNLLHNLDEDSINSAHSRVLEIGCGIGRMLKPFALRYPDLKFIGVDVSEEMIRKGQMRLKGIGNIQLLRTSGKDLDVFEDDYFNLIYSYIVFQHIPRKFVHNYFKEIKRVLAKDGLFIFQMPLPPGHMAMTEPPDTDFRTLRCYSFEEIRSMCGSNDLQIMKTVPIGRHENYAVSSAWYTARKI